MSGTRKVSFSTHWLGYMRLTQKRRSPLAFLAMEGLYAHEDSDGSMTPLDNISSTD